MICYFIINLLFLGFHKIQFSQRSSNPSRTRSVQLCVCEWIKENHFFYPSKPFSEDTDPQSSEMPAGQLKVFCCCVISTRLLLSPAHQQQQPRDAGAGTWACAGEDGCNLQEVFPLATKARLVIATSADRQPSVSKSSLEHPALLVHAMPMCQDKAVRTSSVWSCEKQHQSWLNSPQNSQLSLPGASWAKSLSHLASQCLPLCSSTFVNLVSLTGFCIWIPSHVAKIPQPFPQSLKIPEECSAHLFLVPSLTQICRHRAERMQGQPQLCQNSTN